MIIKFKLYEQLGGYNLGDMVLILYKIPKTEKREMVPVKIITEDGIHYQFSFNTANNPFPHQRPIPFDKTMIINKTADINSVRNPNQSGASDNGQLTPTDYSNTPAYGGKTSNDFVLPNS